MTTVASSVLLKQMQALMQVEEARDKTTATSCYKKISSANVEVRTQFFIVSILEFA